MEVNAVKEHSTAAAAFKGEPVRSYITRFRADEDPISEGGIWLNGKKDALDWMNVVAKNGVAYGAEARVVVAERRSEQGDSVDAPQGDFNDPAALLGGWWGRNQHVKGRVFSKDQTEKYYQEVELRLRSTLTPHFATGYEVFFRCLKTENAYAEIVRWNGKVGDWKSLTRHVGSQYGVKDGDLVEATAIGNVIKGYINGVEVTSVSDDVFEDGSAGIGFNFGVEKTNVDHGFTYLEVNTYDD